MKALQATLVVGALTFSTLAVAAVPREGTWQLQALNADTAVEVRVQGGELVMHRVMHPEYEGQPYTLEHLFRGKLGQGRFTLKMLARDDPKAAFEELREVEVEVISAEEMKLDGTPLLFAEGPAAGSGPIAAPTKAPEPKPVAPTLEPAAAPLPAPAAPLGHGWSTGVGYLGQVVRRTSTREELFGMYRAIAVSKEGEAALAAGDEALDRKAWKQAAASYEAALEAGVPVSRLAPRLGRAYLEAKDCPRAEKMLARAQRLDPDGQEPAELAQALKRACPGAKVAPPPPRLDKAAAAKIVAALEAQTDSGAADRLAHPRSYDDVLEVLKLDQLHLFPAAVAFISTEKDARAQALLAQMELAWAESLQQLAEIDANLAARFRELADEADRKAAASGASAADFGHLKSLRAAAADAQQTSEALKVAVADHLSRGLEVARQVIKQAPTSYLGYRVAADYYRLQGDWKSFDAMIGKLEKANPDSNGLVFLKGVVAYQRGRDTAAAIRLLRQAVVNDPRFARAQAHLVMIQPTLEETWAEFVRLKKMSPSHPIVVWTGPALERLRSEAAGR